MPPKPCPEKEFEDKKNYKECPVCKKGFGMTRWKYNCHNCGKVFCDGCTNDKIACPPVHPKPVKVCAACFAEVKEQQAKQAAAEAEAAKAKALAEEEAKAKEKAEADKKAAAAAAAAAAAEKKTKRTPEEEREHYLTNLKKDIVAAVKARGLMPLKLIEKAAKPSKEGTACILLALTHKDCPHVDTSKDDFPKSDEYAKFMKFVDDVHASLALKEYQVLEDLISFVDEWIDDAAAKPMEAHKPIDWTTIELRGKIGDSASAEDEVKADAKKYDQAMNQLLKVGSKGKETPPEQYAKELVTEIDAWCKDAQTNAENLMSKVMNAVDDAAAEASAKAAEAAEAAKGLMSKGMGLFGKKEEPKKEAEAKEEGDKAREGVNDAVDAKKKAKKSAKELEKEREKAKASEDDDLKKPRGNVRPFYTDEFMEKTCGEHTVSDWLRRLALHASKSKHTKGLGYVNKHMAFYFLKGVTVMQRVKAECLGKELAPWVMHLAKRSMDPKRVVQGMFAAFLYTAALRDCDKPCKTPDECNALKKAEKAQGIEHHQVRRKPENTDAHGWDSSVWSVMNWVMRLDGDLSVRKKPWGEMVPHTVSLFRPLIASIDWLLANIPHERRVVFRGIKVRVSQRYKLNTQVVWPAFSSTSLDYNVAKGYMGGKGTFFLVHVHTATMIDFLSEFPHEKEALLMSNRKFMVANKVSRTILRMLNCEFDIVVMKEIGGSPTPAEAAKGLLVGQKFSAPMYKSYADQYVEARVGPYSDTPEDLIKPLFTALKEFIQDFQTRTWLLLGPGGCGKTAAALTCMSKLSSGDIPAVSHKKHIITLFVPMSSIPNPTEAGAIDCVVLEMLNVPLDCVKYILGPESPYQLVVLFDSLDELRVEENSELYELFHPETNPLMSMAKTIVICRTALMENLIQNGVVSTLGETLRPGGKQMKVSYVNAFTDADVEEYVRNLVKDEIRIANKRYDEKIPPPKKAAEGAANAEEEAEEELEEEEEEGAAEEGAEEVAEEGAAEEEGEALFEEGSEYAYGEEDEAGWEEWEEEEEEEELPEVHTNEYYRKMKDADPDEKANECFAALKERLIGVHYTPIIINMFMSITLCAAPYRQTDEITEYILHNEYIKRAADNKASKESFQVMQDIAIHMLQQGKQNIQVKEVTDIILKHKPDMKLDQAIDYLEDSLPCRVEDANDPECMWGWQHKTLGDFLCVRAIWEEPEKTLKSIKHPVSLQAPSVLRMFASTASHSAANKARLAELAATVFVPAVKATKGSDDEAVLAAGSNALALLVATGEVLCGQDFTGIKIVKCYLHQAKFHHMCLKDATFKQCQMNMATFEFSNIDGISFDDSTCELGLPPLAAKGTLVSWPEAWIISARDGKAREGEGKPTLLSFWEPADGTLQGEVELEGTEEDADARLVTLQADDYTVLVAQGKHVYIVDPDAHEVVNKLAHPNPVLFACIEEYADFVVTLDTENTFRYFMKSGGDPDGEGCEDEYPDGIPPYKEFSAKDGDFHQSPISAMALSYYSKFIFTADEDGLIGVWDKEECKCLSTAVRAKFQHDGQVDVLKVSTNGRSLLSLSSESVTMWDLNMKEKQWDWSPEYSDPLASAALSHDLRFALVGQDCGRVTVINFNTGDTVAQLPTFEADGTISSIFVDQESKNFVSASENGPVRVWNLPGEKPVNDIAGCAETVDYLAISHDGKFLMASTYGMNYFSVFNLITGRMTEHFLEDDHMYMVAQYPFSGKSTKQWFLTAHIEDEEEESGIFVITLRDAVDEFVEMHVDGEVKALCVDSNETNFAAAFDDKISVYGPIPDSTLEEVPLLWTIDVETLPKSVFLTTPTDTTGQLVGAIRSEDNKLAVWNVDDQAPVELSELGVSADVQEGKYLTAAGIVGFRENFEDDALEESFDYDEWGEADWGSEEDEEEEEEEKANAGQNLRKGKFVVYALERDGDAEGDMAFVAAKMGEAPRRVPLPSGANLSDTNVLLHPCNTFALIAYDDKPGVELWDLEAGEARGVLAYGGKPPKPAKEASVKDEGSQKEGEAAASEEKEEEEEDTEEVGSRMVVCSANAKVVVTTEGRSIIVWDITKIPDSVETKPGVVGTPNVMQAAIRRVFNFQKMVSVGGAKGTVGESSPEVFKYLFDAREEGYQSNFVPSSNAPQE